MSETSGKSSSETVLGIAPEVLMSTQNFEDCRNTLNDWLAIQRADGVMIGFEDAEDMTGALVMETAEAFGVMAGSFIREYDAETASAAIAEAWLIDNNERAQLLNALSGTDEIIVQTKEDFDSAVVRVMASEVKAKKAGTKLAAEFGSVLYGNIAEYVCLLEDSADVDGAGATEETDEGFIEVSLEDLIWRSDEIAMKGLRQILAHQREQNI